MGTMLGGAIVTASILQTMLQRTVCGEKQFLFGFKCRETDGTSFPLLDFRWPAASFCSSVISTCVACFAIGLPSMALCVPCILCCIWTSIGSTYSMTNGHPLK